MKYVIVSILFLFFSLFSLGQKTYRDSLETLINASAQTDSITFNRLLLLQKDYLKDDLDKSLSLLKQALEIYPSDSLKKAEVYRSYAIAYRASGKQDKGIEFALKAKAIHDTTDDARQKLLTNSSLLNLYRDQGYLQEALEIARDNLEIVKNDPDSPAKGRYYFELGHCYRVMENFQKADENYLETINMSKRLGFVPGEMAATMALARSYKAQERFPESIELFDKVMPYYIARNNTAGIAQLNSEYGNTYAMMGDHKKAVPYFEKSAPVFDSLKRWNYAQNDYQKLFIGYSILQNQDKAKLANENYNRIKDTLDARARTAAIADMKTKYETDKIAQEKELALAEKELETERANHSTFIAIGLGVLATLAIIIFLLVLSRRKKAQEAEKVRLELIASQKQLALEKQYRDSELKAIKAQMNPHFIYNVLNSIQEVVLTNDRSRASDYIATFADLMRSYLDRSSQQYIPLNEEVQALKQYLKLEKLRFDDKFNFTIDIQEIDPEEIKIPTMLIQPYVENAVKHGLFHKKDQGSLNIAFAKAELQESKSNNSSPMLKITITDDGVGRAKARALREATHKSFATAATQNRIDLLNQLSHQNISVTIDDLDKEIQTGTVVTILLPLIAA